MYQRTIAKLLTSVRVRYGRISSKILNASPCVSLLPNLKFRGGVRVLDTPLSRVKYELPKIETYENCIYSPKYNGVFDLDGRLIPLSALYRGGAKKNSPEKIEIPSVESIETIESALYGGLLFPVHFGHFLTESMARLWPFYSCDYIDDKNIPILFRAASSRTITPSDLFSPAQYILGAAGLLGQLRIENKPLLIKKLIVPGQSIEIGGGVHKVHTDFCQAIGKEIIKTHETESFSTNSKIYYSRSKLRSGDSRKYVNELKLENRMVDLGYSVIHPETLLLPEQIKYFNTSSTIVGPGGSAFFTMLLAKNNDLEVTLFAENTNNCKGPIDYVNIAASVGMNIRFLGCVRNHPLSLNNKGHRGDKVLDIDGIIDFFREGTQ